MPGCLFNFKLSQSRGRLTLLLFYIQYPETTIFFADLVGFTSWSSSRAPKEVFQLLETIFGAFDEISQRRNVYKVETVGDCYVAATGLPSPQEGKIPLNLLLSKPVSIFHDLRHTLRFSLQYPLLLLWTDHAVIMAKFAKDCIFKLQMLRGELVEMLGPDTGDLAMRVGLHSGPVTAGVLRGQKARFQLFGDTVNTASRMESNGMAGRIHVSQSTADELIRAGKNSWLVTREGTVSVKGKGEMQTYFLQGDPFKSTRSLSTSVPSHE